MIPQPEFLNQIDAAGRVFFEANAPQLVVQYDALMAQQHPMVRGWLMMNPVHCVVLVVAYLVIITVGMQVMKGRNPISPKIMKPVMMVHNLVLILLSLYMMVEVINQAMLNNYTLWCNPVRDSEIDMAKVLWLFYVSKFVEFIDTFIMVAKKNNHQVSFLHTYHHSTIAIIWWLVVSIAPGGESYFSAAFNSGIHVLMYTIYLLSALGAPVGAIKSTMTSMQMFQFVCNLVQASYDIYNDCDYPQWIAVMLIFYMISLLALFGNFFVQKYLKSAKNAQKKKKQ